LNFANFLTNNLWLRQLKTYCLAILGLPNFFSLYGQGVWSSFNVFLNTFKRHGIDPSSAKNTTNSLLFTPFVERMPVKCLLYALIPAK